MQMQLFKPVIKLAGSSYWACSRLQLMHLYLRVENGDAMIVWQTEVQACGKSLLQRIDTAHAEYILD